MPLAPDEPMCRPYQLLFMALMLRHTPTVPLLGDTAQAAEAPGACVCEHASVWRVC
jgi:hypothetical protein